MITNTKSIRTFIGAKNFQSSRAFYHRIGFKENIINPKFSYFYLEGNFGFYLQDAYVKDWVNNSMVFLEVDDVEDTLKQLMELDLPSEFENVRISDIKEEDWGKEFFVHDPSGILWHFGSFKSQSTSI